MVTGGFAEDLGIYSATALTTTSGYIRADLVSIPSGAQFPCFVFRYTNSSTPFYEIQFLVDSDAVEWFQVTQIGGSFNSINSQALTIAQGDKLAITWEGTGNSTVVRVWRTTSAGTLNDTPFSVAFWNDGSDGPDVTFTTDPGSPVNSGSFVGIGGYVVPSPTAQWDNFFGGDAP